MNMNSMLKYQLNDYKKPILYYYMIFIAIFILSTGSANITINGSESSIQFAGIEFASMIFLFVTGLNSFKDNFFLGIQNGVTRIEMFKTHLLKTAIIAAIMSVADQIILVIGGQIANAISALEFSGLMQIGYPEYFLNNGLLSLTLTNLVFKFSLYTAAISIGYFITISFYRMSKKLKTIVSVGIPVTLFMLLPMLDELLYSAGIVNIPISSRIGNSLLTAMGITAGIPLIGCIFFLAVTAIMCTLSWLLLRRATIKNR
ncbi:hypothetical protein Q5O14_09250 [Eubacteriaceae bacterium ES2]|nr:hypothetical protein Q5O14_09250 [Eubacteriaceae bacterium ES2]